MNDALAGHVDLIIGSAALIMPQVSAKNIVPLLQTGKTRLPSLPDVQTAIERLRVRILRLVGRVRAGRYAKADYRTFRLGASRLSERPCRQQTPERKPSGQLRLGSPQEEADFLAAQMALWGPVVKENNIKSDI